MIKVDKNIKKLQIKLLLILLILCNTLLTTATEVNYHLRYLTIDDGLPQNTVHAITKDQGGWMWFATGNGLSRFDGYSFELFQKPKIPSNLVNAVVESPDRLLWIGTSQGLVYYNQELQEIFPFELISPTNEPLNIMSLYSDDKGNIWVGTLNHGVFLIAKKDFSYEASNINTSNSLLPGNNVYNFLQMRDGRILIGTNHGIATYDYQRNSVYLFNSGNLQDATVFSMFESMEGDLWVGTYNGLWVFNPRNGRDEWFFHDPFNSNSLSHGRVNHITQDFRGTIYIGTLGGVDIYQPQSNSFKSFPVKKIDEFSLNSMFINVIYADDRGNIWIGTEKGGINQFSLYQKPFNYIVHQPEIANSLSHNTINSILVDEEYLWLGTAGGGLNRMNRKTGEFTCYQHNPADLSTIPGNYVTALLKDAYNNLWVGTWGGGMCKLLSNGTFKRFTPPVPSAETNFENAFVSSFLYDDNNHLYVGTEGGLAILDIVTEEFIKVDVHSPLAQITEVGWLIKDEDNYVWVATRKGLYNFPIDRLNSSYNAISPESFVTMVKEQNYANGKGLPGNYITSLLEDNQNNIWVGTYGDGLVRLIKKKEGDYDYEYFTVDEGLSNNVVYSIQQDDAGFIWASTDYGLSRINPERKVVDNFFTDDGLLSDQFYWSSSYKSDQGELFFGSVNGVNHFFPSALPIYPYTPNVEITSLKVLNKIVKVGDKRHNKTVLSAPISTLDKVSLSYLDNVFSIEFSALDYFNPQKIRYAYQLEGVDRDWVEVSSVQRSATYTNLKGGNYKFKVKAAYNDGDWGDKAKSITVVIRPPFWQTGWFLILLVAAIIVISIFYVRHHTKRLLLEKTRLERMVKERTRKIAEQNNRMRQQSEELKKVNQSLQRRGELIEGQKEELEAKNEEILDQRDRLVELNKEIESINQNRMRFFTNISHEFRTPLTLIISPIERLINEVELSEAALNILQIVQRNARRLNLLIDQLLMFRKIETGVLNVRIAEIDMNQFISEVVHAFDALAEQRKITYTLNMNLEHSMGWMDTEKVENILYNILSNAFKYTPDEGAITVEVSNVLEQRADEEVSMIKIGVSDSGVGVDKEQVEKIFTRFYRSPNGTNTKGSGVGLALTKELVDSMSGAIKYVSKEVGACFELTLPHQKDDFVGAEINETPVFDNSELITKVELVMDEAADGEPFLHQEIDGESQEPLILVVEDNRELALFIANSLSGSYRVQTAVNGKEGYEMARKLSPDVIVSDVMMPVMDGIEMCKQIKSNLYTSHIPIIMLSAKALVEDQLQGVEVGATDYIPKPFNLELLKAKLKNLIESRRKLREMFSSETEFVASKNIASIDEKFLEKSYEVLEASYSNPEFSVEMFSELMFVSRSLLYKKLKALIDLSPNDFITIYRLKKSLPLLSSKGMSINEVAYSVGFNDPKYFSRVFKKFYKKTPTEYLES